jgi:hypothetical protein
MWGERVGELILLAIDETGWLSLVGLNNRGFLSGADRGRPRVDWRDLEDFSEGVIALTGMPGGGGILSSAIEHSANPAEPISQWPSRASDGALVSFGSWRSTPISRSRRRRGTFRSAACRERRTALLSPSLLGLMTYRKNIRVNRAIEPATRPQCCKDCGKLVAPLTGRERVVAKSLRYPPDLCKRCFETTEPRILVSRYSHELASFRANESGDFRPLARTVELSWEALAEALTQSGRRYTVVHQDQRLTRVLFHPTRGMDQISVLQGGAVDSDRHRH